MKSSEMLDALTRVEPPEKEEEFCCGEEDQGAMDMEEFMESIELLEDCKKLFEEINRVSFLHALRKDRVEHMIHDIGQFISTYTIGDTTMDEGEL